MELLPLLKPLAWTMLLISLVGVGIAIRMVALAVIRRVKVLEEKPQDVVARITLRRALRQEVCYLISQVAILSVTLYTMSWLSEAVPQEVPHFLASFAARSVVVLALTYSSLRDMQDRTKLTVALEKDGVPVVVVSTKPTVVVAST